MLLRAELLRLSVSLAVGAAAGWVFRSWAVAWATAFFVYGALTLHEAGRLFRWLRQPRIEHTWDLPGLWGVLEWQIWKALRRRRRALAQSPERARRFEKMLEALPLGVIWLDDQFVIRWHNPAARRLLGLKPDDRGKRLRQLVRMPEFIQWLNDRRFERPLKLVPPRQRYQVLQLQMEPFAGEWVLLVEDITAEHDLAQVRRDFVANASHELRTPVTVFTGYLEQMTGGDDPALAPWQPALRQMQQQAMRMGRIIDDLLTLSAIERTRSLQKAQWVQMSDMFLLLQAEAEQLSRGRHRIVFELRSQAALHGDPDLLRSLFTNLLSNAIRYTPEGGRIWVRWFTDTDGGHFEVEDTGIGIAREHIPRLTERFYRVDTARSRETGGTGLGLAIVKHALELHGGRLYVESTPQVGSRFRADFPPERVGAPEGEAD